jgi:hypothetical protein
MPPGIYQHQRKPLVDRFWAKVTIGPTCWEWTGAMSSTGYGRMTRGGRGEGWVRAHRVAWELANGPVPDGLHVLHHCDNRSCVNPEHLFIGTRSDNMRDAMQKGRLKPHIARAARAAKRAARAAA